MVRSGISGDHVYSSPLSRTYMKTKNHTASQDAEGVHKDALEAAKAEHERVRDIAVQAFINNELRESNTRLQEEQLREEKRLKLERERAETAAKLIELQKISIPLPRPPPRQASPPPAPTTPAQSKAAEPVSEPALPEIPRILSQNQTKPSPSVEPPPRPAQLAQKAPPQQPLTNLFPPPPPSVKLQKPLAERLPTAPPHTAFSGASHVLPGSERYLEIHHTLKRVRKAIEEQVKTDATLKAKSGEIRRQIRKSVGQLTEGRGANRVPQAKIIEMLKDALVNVPSQPIDPSNFLLTTPPPNPTTKNNSPTLPILYIYSLNIFAKSIVRQFIDEAGASPKQADPIGVIAVSIFSNTELLWRGQSLIPILLAKMRVVCPVLFGIRGSEKTEEGRARLGWWKNDDGSWIHEQIHSTRMTGLGAGYAALSLRDFSKTQMENPYPPTNYWRSLSSIVNTPPNEASSTQYTVLKALIENYEQRFMGFYGSAARAALQVALIDFPARAIEKSVAVSAVSVLADKLKRDVGLDLAPKAAAATNGFVARGGTGFGGQAGFGNRGGFG